MIYTLTLSPSIDLLIKGEEFKINQVNRFEEFVILPGGKGINASVVLKRHGFENKAITFFDKTSFSQLKNIFKVENLEVLNISHSKRTRTNVKFFGETNHFELNGPKTKISNSLFNKLKKELDQLKSDDLLMIMGTSNEVLLMNILEIVKAKNINFLIDIDSLQLREFLKYQPFLIKPNKDELERNFNLKIHNEQDLIIAMKELQKIGAKNVIVSLDKDGSYLLTEKQEIFKAEVVKKIDVVSSTGAGDTMISLFAANYLLNSNAEFSLKLASAAAMGTVSSNWVATKELTEKFLSNVKITKIF